MFIHRQIGKKLLYVNKNKIRTLTVKWMELESSLLIQVSQTL